MAQRSKLVWLLAIAVAVACPTASWAAKTLGQACTTHQECQSLRCDNRPAAGCVPQDGTGSSGGFCTTHQQCRTGLCVIASGKYTGVCSGGNRALGQPCTTHQECQSSRCDNRPGAGCVAQDGTGNSGAFCTTHQQCRTGLCVVASGKYTGVCSGGNRALGQACTTHQECQSSRCDNRPGAGCVAQDGRGDANQFCTTHQQCRSGVCTVAAGKIAGQCTGRDIGEVCSVHGDCSSGRCDTRPGAGLCVPQDGTGKPGRLCTTNEQCKKSELIAYCKFSNGILGRCDTKYPSDAGHDPILPMMSSGGSQQTPATPTSPGGQSKCPAGQVWCGTQCIKSGDVCCYQGSDNAFGCSSGSYCCGRCCCSGTTGRTLGCF